MKIWIVNYTSYELDDLYVENKPYINEKDAVNAHKDNMLCIAQELYEEENDIVDWFEEHIGHSHISEAVCDNIYKCSIEEFDV
jgi:hypothetical protein